MRERRMSHIVTERYRFDKIEIQMKCGSNGARYSGYQLNVQTSARYIVIFIK
jgi:hypothetical protein